MQLIERADENDGFQILDLMRKSTSMFSKATSTSDFVDQDKELKKITYKFVEFGVHTYIQSYRRQLRLFVEMGSSFQLPEEYNAQRMIAHLAARCLEFKDCADDFADAVRDGKATYTYAMVEQRFTQCEKRNHLGPKNRGERIPASKLSPDTRAMLVRPPVEEMKQPPRRSEEPKRKSGPYAKTPRRCVSSNKRGWSLYTHSQVRRALHKPNAARNIPRVGIHRNYAATHATCPGSAETKQPAADQWQP